VAERLPLLLSGQWRPIDTYLALSRNAEGIASLLAAGFVNLDAWLRWRVPHSYTTGVLMSFIPGGSMAYATEPGNAYAQLPDRDVAEFYKNIAISLSTVQQRTANALPVGYSKKNSRTACNRY
jgi:hypothetical protein